MRFVDMSNAKRDEWDAAAKEYSKPVKMVDAFDEIFDLQLDGVIEKAREFVRKHIAVQEVPFDSCVLL